MPALLGWSVGLFLAGGAIWVAIGLATPFAMDSKPGRGTFPFAGNDDTKTFGKTPSQAFEDEPNLATLRTVLLALVAGLLVAGGLLVMAVAWWGLREGQAWAHWTLAAVTVAVIPFWILAALPFIQAGVHIRFADIPPFMWVTTALWMPASVLGWFALRTA